MRSNGRNGAVLVIRHTHKGKARRFPEFLPPRGEILSRQRPFAAFGGLVQRPATGKVLGLSLADVKEVKEIRQGLRVVAAGAAADDNGVVPRTLLCQKRDPAQIQDL